MTPFCARAAARTLVVSIAMAFVDLRFYRRPT